MCFRNPSIIPSVSRADKSPFARIPERKKRISSEGEFCMTGTLGLTFLSLISALPVFAAPFRAGAANVDITPENSQWLMGYNARKSTGVRDRIFHRAVALEAGGQAF